MLLSQLFGCPETRSIRRPLARRRPVLEDLEGRQLLTTFLLPDAGYVGHHVGSDLSGIVGNHIGTTVTEDIVGAHIGTTVTKDIVGAHIGTGVTKDIVGAHIGTSATDVMRKP